MIPLKIFPPVVDQEYAMLPAVGLLACKVASGWLQCNSGAGPASAPGGVVFCKTTVCAVCEQPFCRFWIVKMYVPDWFTTGFKVFCPETN